MQLQNIFTYGMDCSKVYLETQKAVFLSLLYACSASSTLREAYKAQAYPSHTQMMGEGKGNHENSIGYIKMSFHTHIGYIKMSFHIPTQT